MGVFVIESANAGGSNVIAAGSLGSGYTLALGGSPRVQLTGTLTANCAMTVTGLTVGCSATLLLQQDSTGGRSLTIDGQSIVVPVAANEFLDVELWSPDGTNLYAQPGPQSRPLRWLLGSRITFGRSLRSPRCSTKTT
jgi:hypothetical protein